ncbi:MAG TPA: hypothetical protein VF411_14535 [Bacteroidia bacterium]
MKKIIGLITAIVTVGLISCNNNQTQTKDKPLQQDKTQRSDTISKAMEEEIKYETYCNQRYNFCIDYPSGLLFPQGESDSGDGQVFKSKDAENTLTVYRDFRDNINPDQTYTIEDAYNEDSRGNNSDKPKRVITYKKLGKSYFVVSGYNEGKIFYQKTAITGGELKTCLLEYKEIDKEVYNKISERIFKSFK